MASFFPNGTQYAVSTALAAAILLTGISNANPAVASAATQPADDSLVLLTSGWPSINNTLRQTTGKTETGFSLKGLDTTDLDVYPAGEGLGSVQVVSDFVPITQVTTDAVSGGDQQFFQFQYIDDVTGVQQQKPTVKSPTVITLTMDYDPSLPWFEALKAADAAKQPVVLRTKLPGGATMYYLAYPSFQENPTRAVNTNMQNVATFSLIRAALRVEAS